MTRQNEETRSPCGRMGTRTAIKHRPLRRPPAPSQALRPVDGGAASNCLVASSLSCAASPAMTARRLLQREDVTSCRLSKARPAACVRSERFHDALGWTRWRSPGGRLEPGEHSPPLITGVVIPGVVILRRRDLGVVIPGGADPQLPADGEATSVPNDVPRSGSCGQDRQRKEKRR